jgi:hypothetical protein
LGRIYVKAGIGKEKAALLVVIGVQKDGQKRFLALEPGYRESKESWGFGAAAIESARSKKRHAVRRRWAPGIAG